MQVIFTGIEGVSKGNYRDLFKSIQDIVIE